MTDTAQQLPDPRLYIGGEIAIAGANNLGRISSIPGYPQIKLVTYADIVPPHKPTLKGKWVLCSRMYQYTRGYDETPSQEDVETFMEDCVRAYEEAKGEYE